MKFLALCGLFCLSLAVRAAENDWRIWKSASGTKIEAKLIAKTPTDVTLERRDGKPLTVKLGQLSPEDQAFLSGTVAPAGAVKATVEGISAVPGVTSSAIPCVADPTWSYLLYLPKAFDSSRLWPVCFIMAPGGGDSRNMTPYLLAAEELGIVLALSNEAKSKFDDSDLAVAAMVKDVYARLPILKSLTMATGMSSGAKMAYLLAEREKSVAGVLACASGSGVFEKDAGYRDAKIRPSTVVYSLMGASDYSRRDAVKAHTGFSKNSRILWFPGSHAMADDALIFRGLAGLYGEILAASREPNSVALREAFSKTLFAWAKQQKGSSPDIAYQWGEYLANFQGDPQVRTEAAALVSELAKAPMVVRSLKAEEIIRDFTAEHHSDGDTKADTTADPTRLKEAERKAADFEDLPQAEILKRLGREVTGG